MRFAGANNNSNFIEAGRTSGQMSSDIARSVISNSPDYGGMARAWQEAESSKFRTAVKAGANVVQAGIKSDASMKRTDAKISEKRTLDEQKRKSKMAGKLAAMAATAIKAFDKEPPPIPPAQIDVEALRRLTEQRNAANPYPTSDKPDKPDQPEEPAAQSDEPPISSGQALEDTPNADVPSGDFSVEQMKTLLVNNGMSPENASILARVGMGESGGRSGIDTVQSGLDPNQSNEYSIGLWQINTQAHGDKLDRRGWTNEDLRDPNKNAQIAIEVFNEAGGFTPWTVYTNGSWRNY